MKWQAVNVLSAYDGLLRDWYEGVTIDILDTSISREEREARQRALFFATLRERRAFVRKLRLV